MVDKRMSQSFKIILVTVKSDLSRDQERHGVMSVCVCGGGVTQTHRSRSDLDGRPRHSRSASSIERDLGFGKRSEKKV